MSAILEKMRAAHDAQAGVLTPVPVPEYDEVWYFRPITLVDQQKCRQGVNMKSVNAEQELLINLIIHLALDAEGKRIFDLPLSEIPQLKAELHRMQMKTLMRIGLQSQGGLDDAPAQEISDLSEDATRAALVGAFAESAPLLSEAFKDADFDAIRQALVEVAVAAASAGSAKNA